MTMADKERAAMDRCYEVDIGDRVEIDTHDEGTVQGEVTNMLWRGDLGFRQPDAIEVQWKGSKGELQMGEIEMWEQWRKVGEGQEGEDRGVQPADVSAKTNETDARDRESGADAPSVLEGAQMREGNTGGEPEAGTQGSTGGSVRARLSDMGGEGNGVCEEARTYVRTYERGRT